ncbi:protein of unknown function [Modestobacter italicus]|uniref:Uncharacterized protein n=1 Tax=Modestobacter italicus (strain DSM 44449 / CECT 9708 / BC 501) TaxID=2732864 RepID=I4EQY6_MODI5|nr:protein of unknown function [Modestobacter marinus]
MPTDCGQHAARRGVSRSGRPCRLLDGARRVVSRTTRHSRRISHRAGGTGVVDLLATLDTGHDRERCALNSEPLAIGPTRIEAPRRGRLGE